MTWLEEATESRGREAEKPWSEQQKKSVKLVET